MVRPATDTLEPTVAALRHLEQIGGDSFRNQLAIREPLDIGAATVTGGGGLSAKFVIHAVIRSATEPVSAVGIRRALTSALHQAAAWEFGSVAMPPLGTGPGNLPLEAAAHLMCDVLHRHLREHDYPSLVTLVTETDEDRDVVQQAITAGGV